MSKNFEIESFEKKRILELYSSNNKEHINEQIGTAIAFIIGGLAFGFGTKQIQLMFLLSRLNSLIENTLESIEELNKKFSENKSYYGEGTEIQQEEFRKILMINYKTLKSFNDSIASHIGNDDMGGRDISRDEFNRQVLNKLDKESQLNTAKPQTSTTSTNQSPTLDKDNTDKFRIRNPK